MGNEDLIQTKSFNLEVCTLIEGLVNFFDRSPRTGLEYVRSFPHRIDCWIMQFFENSTFALVSLSSESLLTGAVERSLGIYGCRIVSAIVVGISSTFTDV